MIVKRLRVGCMVAALVGGCAPLPERIAPAPIDPARFGRLGCADLAAMQARLQRRLAALSAEQSQSRADDTLGVLIAQRPLASLSGGDLRDHLALTKGELRLLDMRLTRDCGR